jgi:cystathionine beta-lyase
MAPEHDAIDAPTTRAGTMSRKWDRYASRGDPAPLWVADMDFRAPRAVVDAVTDVARRGIYGYADPDAATIAAATTRFREWHGVADADADAVRWLPGLNPGLNHAVRAARRARGAGRVTTATCAPIYPPFSYASRNDEGGKAEVTLRRTIEDGRARYDVDWDALEEALAREDVAVLLWCNPHNPIGRVWTRDEMTRVARLCVAHDVVLCSDEVWRELILDETATPFCGAGSLMDDVDGLRERLIVMTSPSKTYNVAGCDVAMAYVPDRTLRAHFARAGADKAEITPFGYAAMLAAYTDPSCEAWRQRLLETLRANRDRVDAALAEDANARALVTWTVPDASYLTWLNCEALVERVERSPFEHFLEHGVALSDGAPFSAPRAARVNFATTREILDRGLTGIASALASASRRDVSH